MNINKKKILLEVRFFIVEYLALSFLCMLGMLSAWYYHKVIAMDIIVMPVSVGYFIFFLNKLINIYVDIHTIDITYDDFGIATFIRKKFEVLLTKEYYKVEVYNNNDSNCQKKTFVMKNKVCVEPGKLVNVAYLNRSKIIISIKPRLQ